MHRLQCREWWGAEVIPRDTHQHYLIMLLIMCRVQSCGEVTSWALCSLCRGSSEEEAALRTNKQVYSLLLRATASKGLSLLERTELLLSLLEQLAPRGQGSPGLQ